MVEDLETRFEFPIAGTLRIGEKNEKNLPKRLNYFTVHNDTHTINDVVEQFNTNYDKPTELTIRFLSDNPLETSYLKYGKSGLLCKGNGIVANCKSENGWNECSCSKECDYRGTECKLTGRLFFVMKELNIGGLWRFQTQSYNTIRNFLTTLNFLKCMGVDIKKRDFRLATEEKTSVVEGKVKKFTTVTLKMLGNKDELINRKKENKTTDIENSVAEDKSEEIKEKSTKKSKTQEGKSEIIKSEVSEKQNKNGNEIEEKNENVSSTVDEFEKCLTLVELKDVTIGQNAVKKAIFCNINDEVIELLLHPDIVKEVSNWEVASCIIPVNVYEKNGNKILKEFKDIKIIKKAV